MIRLEKINGKNIRDILQLKVREEQNKFVASNDISIMEAFVALTSNGHAFPFGIFDDETPVGFCMIGYGTDDSWEDAPAVAKDSYNIWRFMIGQQYQGRGYGRSAMKLILDYIATEPCGPAQLCWLSYDPENFGAKALYASFGFEETGEWDGDEIIAVKQISRDDDIPCRHETDFPERIVIRKAAPEDASAVAELAVLLWPEHTPESLAGEMRSLLSDRESAVFLAAADDQPVAFAQCQLRHDYVEGTESSPVGYLEGIYVSASCRHRGIAGRLLHCCEQWAGAAGCREFASDCELNNEGSRRFHLQMGFAEANRIICFTKKL